MMIHQIYLQISETCQIALDRLSWLRKTSSNQISSEKNYTTIDPAPPSTLTTIDELKKILLDENHSLFERYRAMFALRNIGSDEAVLAICEGRIYYLYNENMINMILNL